MSSPSLKETQEWMRERIRPAGRPGGAGDTLLNPQRDTPGEERLSVYAGGYYARIRQSLGEVYGAVRHILGSKVFGETSDAYAQSQPSHEYNITQAGRLFPEFLSRAPISQRLPFLPDLARLEWTVCESFHAFDQSPVDPQRFAALSMEAWGKARLILQPSVRLASSAWPILDLWQARTQPREAINVDLVNRPQRVLIFRKGVEVFCRLIDEPQRELLRRLQSGEPLGAACAAAFMDDPSTISTWFSSWTSDGLFQGIETG
jgi:hypothetical protein